ncbi:MAG: cation:proton antiporter [Syntrophobacterales bacterium]|jgi:CPA2 family monovalent cation:H+ antiporter-2|nr:cation:proton antiporter [Syntrophobacterales bacterium]
MHELTLVNDLALILVSAGVMTLIFRRFKQPLVLGYIVAGFLISPYFDLFPTVVSENNVAEWAEIGVIFLLFALGLEFSFKKMFNVGAAASITAITEMAAMLCIGFFVGHLLGWTTLESIFLGGMLAMSSTTIIIKAFEDLKLRNQKFTNIVFGTLIIEDILGILMMVMLSTIAVSKGVAGGEMGLGLLKLSFFLILCFLIGIYILPTFFRQFRNWLNDETLMVISIGLCFGLVALATHFGFSAALGAFIMGSILAETIEGAHIEHLTKNIKDFFGAVFFVSVGMMVNPHTLAEYWLPILILTLVTIFGKTFFSFLGVLLSGQPLKVSMQAGFSLAQIGEFAFIIATLGYTLGVMREFIYPIIVAISVITTFTTPYFVRLANPFYDWLNPKLPWRFKTFLDNYSSGGDIAKDESHWKKFVKRYLINALIYSVLSIAVVLCFTHFVCPFVVREFSGHLPDLLIGLINSLLTIIAMIPFLMGLVVVSRKNREIAAKLIADGHSATRRGLTALTILRLFLATFFVMLVLFINFKTTSSWLTILLLSAIMGFLFLAHKNFKAHWIMEDHFLSNLLQKEEYERQKSPLRSSINSQLSDIHLAKIIVSPDAPLVGKRLREIDLRKNYNVNIVKIIRGHKEIYFPGGDDFIYPSDHLTAIGTDEQISSFSQIMEIENMDEPQIQKGDVELSSFVIKEDSPILGKDLMQTEFRSSGCMVIKVDRGEETFTNPDGAFIFAEGDLVWIAGEREKIQQFV